MKQNYNFEHTISIFLISLFFFLPVNLFGQNKRQIAKVNSKMEEAIANNTKRGDYYFVDLTEYIGNGAVTRQTIEKMFDTEEYSIRSIATKKIKLGKNPFVETYATKTIVKSFQFRLRVELEKIKKEKELEAERIRIERQKEKERRLAEEEERKRIRAEHYESNRDEYIRKAISLRKSAELLFQQGDLSAAVDSLINSKNIFLEYSTLSDDENFELSITLNLLGSIYNQAGKFTSASSNLSSAISIRESLKSKVDSFDFYLGESQLNLANVKMNRENYYGAIQTLNEALTNLENEEKPSFYYSESYNLLGLAYQYSKKYNQALVNYDKAKENFKLIKDGDYLLNIGIVDRRIGMVNYFLRAYTESRNYLVLSVEALEKCVLNSPGYQTESETVRSKMLLGEILITKLNNRSAGLEELSSAYELGSKYYDRGDRQFDAFMDQIIKLRRKYGS